MKKLLPVFVLCFLLNSVQANIVLDTSAMLDQNSQIPIPGTVAIDQYQEGYFYGFAYDNEDPQNTSAAIRYQTFIPSKSTLEKLDLYLEVWQRNDSQGGMEKPYGDTIHADITIEDSSGTPVWNLDYTYDGSSGFKSCWFSFRIPSITLIPGETYKIQVLGHGIWRGNSQSDYSGISDVAGDWPNYDYAFRTYYGSNDVPEPATMILIGLGSFALRKRK